MKWDIQGQTAGGWNKDTAAYAETKVLKTVIVSGTNLGTGTFDIIVKDTAGWAPVSGGSFDLADGAIAKSFNLSNFQAISLDIKTDITGTNVFVEVL